MPFMVGAHNLAICNCSCVFSHCAAMLHGTTRSGLGINHALSFTIVSFFVMCRHLQIKSLQVSLSCSVLSPVITPLSYMQLPAQCFTPLQHLSSLQLGGWSADVMHSCIHGLSSSIRGLQHLTVVPRGPVSAMAVHVLMQVQVA